MPKIQVLPKHVAELIAAGEVVDRPSSVIKELVENAVDAGSSAVTVEIQHGGVSFMRVTDNGCGVSREDVPTAFLRHATSKIRAEDDLASIGTLGFRGEALASISAVAHVELLTRPREEPIGTRYRCGGEEEPVLEDAGCPVGTTILIRDLFFNTPARMKFLKKDVTEGNSVAGVLDKMALSHPEISFRFIRDGKEALRTPGDNKLSSAVYGVYGREFLSTLIPVEYEYEHIRVHGFVSAPTKSRPNRSMQSFFLNGRFVRSRTAMAALEEAYKGSIMVGKFPACVLHLELAASAVDVNVHPAKLEVRFVNERPVFDAVYHAVRSALQAGDAPKVMELRQPASDPRAPLPEKPQQLGFAPLPAQERPARPAEVPSRREALKESLLRDSARRDVGFTRFADEILEAEEDVPPPAAPVFAPEPSAQAPDEAPKAASAPPRLTLSGEVRSKLIGEAFGTYIVVEYSPQALMLIDKHAAHERLLYEKLKAAPPETAAQTLLEPIPVTLSKEEYSAVLLGAERLQETGFEVEDFGSGTVLVRAVPLVLDGSDAAAALMEIAGYLAGLRHDLTPEHLDWVYHNVACRAAMKGGDHTSREELIALAEELERNPEVRYCPHGRPVYMLIARKDIERQFGRA